MSDERDNRDRVVAAAALGLASEHGDWTAVPLAAIMERAGLSAEDAERHFPCKVSCLAAIMRDTDARVSAENMTFEEEDMARDRLFAVLMSRIDALAKNRKGYAAILRDVTRDPVTLILLAPTLHKSMHRMLELADVSASTRDFPKPAGKICDSVRAKGLAAVWLSSLRSWLVDESEDFSSTMAALDRSLQRAETFANMFRFPTAPEDAPDPA